MGLLIMGCLHILGGGYVLYLTLGRDSSGRDSYPHAIKGFVRVIVSLVAAFGLYLAHFHAQTGCN